MGKRAKTPRASVTAVDVPVVGLREPCPCGSGRRYKACHGRGAAAVIVGSSRPFAGLAAECDIVAMREIVPAATARLALTGEHADRDVTLATVLPMAWPALVRQDGSILLGLQVNVGSGDASRDVADALLGALDAEPGAPVALGRVGADSPRLQDLIDADAPFDVAVHDGFDFWIDTDGEVADEVRASLDRAKSYANPTVRLQSVAAAYWTQIGDKEHLRWVTPFAEEPLLDGLARLHAAGADDLGEGTRLVGMFRAHGLVCPVWDLPLGTGAEAIQEPAAAFAARLADAMAEQSPLTAAQRGARAGLATRQVTLR